LTKAFAKKIQHYAAMVAIDAVLYNYAWIPQTAKYNGWFERPHWTLEEIVTSYMPKPGKRGPYKKQ